VVLQGASRAARGVLPAVPGWGGLQCAVREIARSTAGNGGTVCAEGGLRRPGGADSIVKVRLAAEAGPGSLVGAEVRFDIVRPFREPGRLRAAGAALMNLAHLQPAHAGPESQRPHLACRDVQGQYPDASIRQEVLHHAQNNVTRLLRARMVG
jgi:hypothetical protein